MWHPFPPLQEGLVLFTSPWALLGVNSSPAFFGLQPFICSPSCFPPPHHHLLSHVCHQLCTLHFTLCKCLLRLLAAFRQFFPQLMLPGLAPCLLKKFRAGLA